MDLVKRALWASFVKARMLSRIAAPWGVRQIQDISCPDVLVIGPATMSIPPNGWGAVETVIDEQIRVLSSLGLRVSLLNSVFLGDWLMSFSRRPKVAICHYDRWATAFMLFCRLFGVKPVATTHFAFASNPKMWPKQYRKNLSLLAKNSNPFICLSQDIRQTLENEFGQAVLTTFPNRMLSSPNPRARSDGGRVACIGKVEPRKSQVFLAGILDEEFLESIDFVGPISDPSFTQLPANKRKAFKGEWSRGELWKRLADYRFVMLPSMAEADALVLHEALLAGCEVITTVTALGSQDKNLPYVHIIDLKSPGLSEQLNTVMKSTPFPSKEIRRSAKEISLWTQESSLSFASIVFSNHLGSRFFGDT